MTKKGKKIKRGHALDANGRPFNRAKIWSRTGRDTSPRKDRRDSKERIRKEDC